MDVAGFVAVLALAGALLLLAAAVRPLVSVARQLVTLVRQRAQREPAPTVREVVPVPVPVPGDVRTYVVLVRDEILRLYQQVPGADIEQREVEETRGTDVRGTVDASVAGGEIGRTAGTTVRTTFGRITDVQALAVAEQHLQADGGIQSFDLTGPSDDGPLTDLLKDLRAGADRIGLRVPDEVPDGLRRVWREQSRRIPDATLRSLGLYVRLRAEFTIDLRDSGDRVLTATTWDDAARPVHVRIVCPHPHIRPDFFPEHGTLTATCFGVSSWDDDARVLELRPFSVHRSRGRA